ncbi:hypothetical protein BH11PSE10_BH11PSE10_02620 [soil metagenome]
MNAAALVKSKLTHRSLWLLLSLGLMIGLAKPAAAQSGDPPARVARVAEVIGDAWLFDTESREWTRVTRNQTVAEGDRLRTDERSRISLRIGSTNVWLDERSDLAFDQLDEGQVLMLLDKGDLGLRLRAHDAATDFRIRTREGMVFTERDGLYRVEQMDRGSKAYVFNGRLRFEAERGGGGGNSGVPPVWLQNGEQAEFWWANGARVERQRLENDGFGDWLVAQNQRDSDMSISRRYVSPEMTGAEDLDRNGRWEQANEFGSVWIPSSVNAGWVPYRDGRWVWTSHWGWSWVDDQPWGFAPFHYGRWVQWGGRWCWAPGRYVARPVYAPALVAWVGGPRLNIGVNVGGGGRYSPPRHGWVPLAPREAYVPAYRHSPTYVVRVNNGDHDPVTVNRPHRNQNVVGAVSYLPGQGGPARALPPADGVGPMRPVLTPMAPPARGDFAGLQPAPRPVADVRNAPQLGGGNNNGMPWRSEGERRRGGQREQQDQQQQQQQQPPRAMPAPVPVPAVTAEPALQQRAPDRAFDGNNNRNNNRNNSSSSNNNERVGPSRPHGFERPQEQRQFEQVPRAVEQQQQQQQAPRQVEQQRPVEQQQQPRPQVERPRPVEMPAQVVRPQPQPQPQMSAAPAPPAQRAEDRGPQRGRQDGPRGRERERENER